MIPAPKQDKTLIYVSRGTCKKIIKNKPNFYPYISSLSQYSSPFNFTIKLYIYGENFLPNGLTKVDFGNIPNIEFKYINSNTLYFELQNFTFPGLYNIVVKNTINISAKNPTANTFNGMILKSNPMQYTIVH